MTHDEDTLRLIEAARQYRLAYRLTPFGTVERAAQRALFAALEAFDEPAMVLFEDEQP